MVVGLKIRKVKQNRSWQSFNKNVFTYFLRTGKNSQKNYVKLFMKKGRLRCGLRVGIFQTFGIFCRKFLIRKCIYPVENRSFFNKFWLLAPKNTLEDGKNSEEKFVKLFTKKGRLRCGLRVGIFQTFGVFCRKFLIRKCILPCRK